MYKPPRWYYRAESTQHTYEEYLELVKEPINTPEKKQALLNIIKRMYVVYWKSLKDRLREENIIEYFPKKIFKTAIQKNYIKDDELIWIEYIDLLNRILYEKNIDKSIIVEKIIAKFSDKIIKINDYIQNLSQSIENYQSNSLNIDLPYNMPVYSCDIIGIEEYAYNILINYFKAVSQIEYIWLHGSRAVGQARFNSDIDLLVSCPIDKMENIKYQLNKLRIPYRIDISNINDNEKNNFIRHTSKYAKIIYRKEDFKKLENNIE